MYILTDSGQKDLRLEMFKFYSKNNFLDGLWIWAIDVRDL